jgi:HD-GYP domain-containing protein (c-di-GMP phosphodiesterase class II)
MVRSIGIEPYEVADQGKWFTQAQINRFYATVVEATGNENIAREAGRYSASSEALGSIRQYILALFGPAKAFALGSKLSETLTKSADYETQVLSDNSVEIRVHLREGMQEEPFQCQNRIGVFEAIISLFNLKPPVIEHKQCMFAGAKCCQYIITWQPNAATRIKRGRDTYAFLALFANIALAISSPGLLQYILPVSVVGLFGLNWWLEASRRKVGESTLEQLRDVTEQINEHIDINYRNTKMSREIGEALTSKNNIDAVISTVIEVLKKDLDYENGLILLANEQEQRLEIRGAFGYTDEHLELLETTSFSLKNPNSEGPFVVSYQQQKPLLINDVNKISSKISLKSQKFIDALGTKNFLTVPIILENKSIGIIAVSNHQHKKPLVNSDVNLLMGIAPTIGISFNNAELNEVRENQFAAIIKVLAHSIDARDFLTAGHSDQVAEYTIGTAMELGLQHEYCQMLRIAALLHDYGKIGVPDTVLKKNGPLTDEERALIQTHSEKSHDILSQIPFEGIYQEVPLIALHHHERWDGTGYPAGLKGEEIPYGARIVAVADFFEAITSKRHYREPMQIDIAVDLLKKETGSHFDEQIVPAFLRYLNSSQNQEDAKEGTNPLPRLRDKRYIFQTMVQAKVDDLVIDGTTIDISKGGIFLQIDRDLLHTLERNKSLKMQIALPNSDKITVAGNIRWMNLDSEQRSKSYPTGLGIAFSELDQKAQQLLNRTLNTLENSQRKISLPRPLLEA